MRTSSRLRRGVRRCCFADGRVYTRFWIVSEQEVSQMLAVATLLAKNRMAAAHAIERFFTLNLSICFFVDGLCVVHVLGQLRTSFYVVVKNE